MNRLLLFSFQWLFAIYSINHLITVLFFCSCVKLVSISKCFWNFVCYSCYYLLWSSTLSRNWSRMSCARVLSHYSRVSLLPLHTDGFVYIAKQIDIESWAYSIECGRMWHHTLRNTNMWINDLCDLSSDYICAVCSALASRQWNLLQNVLVWFLLPQIVVFFSSSILCVFFSILCCCDHTDRVQYFKAINTTAEKKN